MYKHERDKLQVPAIPGIDRRIKLTETQRVEIAAATTETTTGLARRFGVSRRTIEFIRNPESKAQMLLRRKERGGWKQYYDPTKHAAQVKRTRKWRTELDKKGLLIKKDQAK